MLIFDVINIANWADTVLMEYNDDMMMMKTMHMYCETFT